MSQSTVKKNPVRGHDHSQMSSELDYENQYVSFWVDNQLLGVPVNSVQEVLNPQSIARTPKSRAEIAGLVNLRGQIVTALDLRRRLGLPPFESEQGSMNVVIRNKNEPFSLLVDEVGDVINVSRDLMKSVPPTLDARWRDVTTGVFRLDDRLFVILNIDAILSF
ncbi:Chemotaxis protein CheW [Polystyrenella longa]|uniref:Chemotaxis protein CheW n=1 Tax=Polystyrenella longa TaxID=2528007 RepID=A0A518CGS1_9PLAN|nr:chemotaxis protein CheW [Polystyrenella longa]QDU78420.1 Chemotaxis protein CheW [Polystyrenella longa]